MLKYPKVQPEHRLAFVLSLLHLSPRLGRVVVPRLCLIAFTFAQPFLITKVLDLLYKPNNDAGQFEGYLLILATALVYLGIAVCRPLHTCYAPFS
jgi:ATP-binding cassette subfamily C (CFTR/MRP) protein 1